MEVKSTFPSIMMKYFTCSLVKNHLKQVKYFYFE